MLLAKRRTLQWTQLLAGYKRRAPRPVPVKAFEPLDTLQIDEFDRGTRECASDSLMVDEGLQNEPWWLVVVVHATVADGRGTGNTTHKHGNGIVGALCSFAPILSHTVGPTFHGWAVAHSILWDS